MAKTNQNKAAEAEQQEGPQPKLVVRQPFLAYQRGDVITGSEAIALALDEYPHHVTKVVA